MNDVLLDSQRKSTRLIPICSLNPTKKNMPTYKIECCTVDDAAALARNNMSAYYTDPTWILNWEKGRPLQDIIAECTKRTPTTLLRDRAQKRHQKVVDETGAVVGYARWILPDRLTGEWLEAQTPAVSPSEEEEYMRLFCSARWTREAEVNSLGSPLEVIMERLMRGKEYLGKIYFIHPHAYHSQKTGFYLLTVPELEYLAVHPDYQGRGIATLLVESGIAEAEKIGVDVIVMAYKSALGVYKRLGFETAEYLIQDDSKYGGKGEFGAYFMVRNVKKD